MMNEYQNTLNVVNNSQKTENGALGFSTSGQSLVDLNFRVPSNHNNVAQKDLNTFDNALNENLVYAIKWMFYLRDIRFGNGERDSFITLFMHLYQTNKEVALKVISLIPEFGRWKDLVDLLGNDTNDYSPLCSAIYDIVEKQLKEDVLNMELGKSVSLLAKWMPSINASKKSRRLAIRFCMNLKLDYSQYRKMLSTLRRYIDVTEVKTCGNKWNEIDYNKVSSNANSRYLNAFMKHDEIRRKSYLNDLKHPELTGAVMHASNLYPYEVYTKYSSVCRHRTEYTHLDDGIEALWNNLKDVQSVGNTMVICDGSGSMNVPVIGNTWAIDISRSLSVYFAEKCEGEFHNKVIEFSSTPRYIDLTQCKTLADKVNIMKRYTDCSNTNLGLVFDTVLDTAIRYNMNQSELPDRFLIVSDMEFDAAGEFVYDENNFWHNNCKSHEEVMSRYQTLFQAIKQKWDNAGYKMPQIVFWNVNSKTQTIPVTSNECGVILVSGFSVNNVDMIMSGETNPWKALKSVLDSPRYSVIDDVLNS